MMCRPEIVFVAEINYASLNWVLGCPSCSITLGRKKFQLVLFSGDEDVIRRWVDGFRKVCILTDYNVSYHTVKVIGKGSFAKVYLAHRRDTEGQFAVKSFSKE